MFNPNDEVHRNRLFKAMEVSYRRLDPFRRLVVGLVEEYAGSGYGAEGSRPRYETLVNLMNQAVDAYTMSLAANRPRVLVSTSHMQHVYFAKMFETAVNNMIQEIELEQVLRQAVLDAFFCVGVVKVHMADSAQVQLETGLWMDPGTPFASNIALDNWVHDTSATEWHKMKYAGDMYRLPFEDLKRGDMFEQDVVKNLQPSSKYASEDDRLEQISKGYETDADEFEPMIDLADIWIPDENKIFTWAVDRGQDKFVAKGRPVAVMDWTGPEFGPYHKLSFNDVPENIMPTSPASHLAGLARLANNLIRKQSRQARRQKDVYTYTPAGAESAKKIQRTSDGEWVEVQSKDEVGVMKMQGVDPGNQAFFVGVTQMFDRMAGNLATMAGLGTQADTATQEQMLSAKVSKKEAQMQYRTLDFSKRICRDLGWMLWSDAVKSMPMEMPIEGTEYSEQVLWKPDDREGDFLDYNFDIDVHSMPYQSPGQRVQALTQLVTTVYAPMAQVMAQQGGMINFQKLTEIYSDLLNLPRLKEVVQFTTPSEQEMPTEERPGKSPTSTRNYVRQSIPTSGTTQSRAHVEQQGWLNRMGQNNPDQEAQLTQ